MKTKRGLFLLIMLVITIRAGFAQGIQQVTQYPNLVKNGDFEDGNVGFKSDFLCQDDIFTWGYYVITTNVSKYLTGSVFLNPVPNTGKYYAIDMNNSGKQRLWYDSITVKPNTPYQFSCILANCVNDFAAPGVINLKINGKKICPTLTLSNGSASWTPYSIKYKTGPDETRIEISIVDEIWTLMGNDVALDNVVFKEIPPEEYTTVCEVKFKKLTEEEKGPVTINDKVDKEQKAIVEKRKADSVAVVVAIAEKKKADSVAVVVEKQRVVAKRKADSVAVVVAKQKEDSIVAVVAKQKEDSIIAVVAKQKEDSVAALAVVTKPKDPVVIKPKDPIVIKPKDPVVIKPKDPVVIKPKDPVVIKPKDPVVIKPKDPVVATIKKKPTEPIKFTKDISDEDLQEGVKLEMGHIYFDQGKAHLKDASKPELNELVELMKKHPKLRIRLEGHTTNDGNPQKNIILSEDRVKEVKKYLVEKGIAENRVEWIGYGGAKPLINRDGTPGKKELNRRVEVEIIENSK
jgi:outer membrane protein OmpA-like peptidoglycan-associated protein